MCFPFLRRGSDAPKFIRSSIDEVEPYEFVVEKLAIRRVSLRGKEAEGDRTSLFSNPSDRPSPRTSPYGDDPSLSQIQSVESAQRAISVESDLMRDEVDRRGSAPKFWFKPPPKPITASYVSPVAQSQEAPAGRLQDAPTRRSMEPTLRTLRGAPARGSRDVPGRTPQVPGKQPQEVPMKTPPEVPQKTQRGVPSQTKQNIPLKTQRDIDRKTQRDTAGKTPRGVIVKPPRDVQVKKSRETETKKSREIFARKKKSGPPPDIEETITALGTARHPIIPVTDYCSQTTRKYDFISKAVDCPSARSSKVCCSASECVTKPKKRSVESGLSNYSSDVCGRTVSTSTTSRRSSLYCSKSSKMKVKEKCLPKQPFWCPIHIKTDPTLKSQHSKKTCFLLPWPKACTPKPSVCTNKICNYSKKHPGEICMQKCTSKDIIKMSNKHVRTKKSGSCIPRQWRCTPKAVSATSSSSMPRRKSSSVCTTKKQCQEQACNFVTSFSTPYDCTDNSSDDIEEIFTYPSSSIGTFLSYPSMCIEEEISPCASVKYRDFDDCCTPKPTTCTPKVKETEKSKCTPKDSQNMKWKIIIKHHNSNTNDQKKDDPKTSKPGCSPKHKGYKYDLQFK